MPRVSPAPAERFAEVSDYTERWKKTKGYPPNTWLTMVRRPKVFRAYRDLHSAAMMDEGEVPTALKFMIAYTVSRACGDAYTAAHNAENAAHIGGVALEKVEALERFRESPHFTRPERAALELAAAAGACPPAVTDAHFAELKKYYSDEAIVEIVAVLALLGWLNRWCMTFAVEIEERALEFAQKHLAASGWTPGGYSRRRLPGRSE
jgi:alkylhydroperoxidase family enzyme